MSPGVNKTTIKFFLTKIGPFCHNFEKALGAFMRRDDFVVCAESEILTFFAGAEIQYLGASFQYLGALFLESTASFEI